MRILYKQSQSGSALIGLIGVFLLLAVMGLAIIPLTQTSQQTALSAGTGGEAHYLAESGLRYAQYVHPPNNWNNGVTETLSMQDGAEIRVTRVGRSFVSTATINAGTAMEARARVTGRVPIWGERPDDYVIYSGGGGGFVLPPGGTVDGSIHGEHIRIQPNVTITENVVSQTSVELMPGTKVHGFVCATNGDVELGSNTVVGGDISAFGDVTLGNNAVVLGSIYATGTVTIRSSFVGGDIHAGTNFVSKDAEVAGSVYTGRDINLDSTKIGGDAHAGRYLYSSGGSSAGGSAMAGGNINQLNNTNPGKNRNSPPRIEPDDPDGCPLPPPPPLMQSFTAGTTDVVVARNEYRIVSPGTYRNLVVERDAIVVLQAGDCAEVGRSGCYVFRTFGFDGNQTRPFTLRLDLSTGKEITVFSEGSIGFGGSVEVRSTPGGPFVPIQNISAEDRRQLARRVYWETSETFSANAQWFGTLLSKDGISIGRGSGSGFFAIGAFATVEGAIEVQTSSQTIHFFIADFARKHWLPD